MKLFEMREEARILAIRIVGRKTARKIGYPDIEGMMEAARRMYATGRLGRAGGISTAEWAEVAAILERLLTEAAAAGEIKDVHEPEKKRVHWPCEGRNTPSYQDDDGFFKRG